MPLTGRDLTSRTDEHLLEMVHSVDYRPEARDAAKQLLQDRGFSEDQIAAWREPLAELPVESWVYGRSPDVLRRSYRRRRLLYRLTAFCLVASFASGFVIPDDRHDTAAMVFTIAFYLFLAIHAGWRAPARILLLRPFNRPASTPVLRRYVKRHLTHFGHVYTLADSGFQPKTRSTIWSRGDTFLWGWPAYILGFRKTVANDYKLEGLKSALKHRLVRNINWSMSVDGIFKISVDDTHWQRALQLLATSADVVVIELSQAPPGLQWEMNELRHYGLTSKILFVSSVDDQAAARSNADAAGYSGRPLFAYDSSGRVRDTALFAETFIEVASGASSVD
jgi:hypothetical protein